MKMKKLLALLLACIMLCGVFAVVPVSAAEATDVIVDDGFAFKAYQPEKHPGWATAPTVEGYDAYYKLDGSYAITTKETYDMNDTSIRLNFDYAPAKGNSVLVTVSPDNYNTFGVRDDVDNGKITFVLDLNFSDTSFRVYSIAGYKSLDKVFPKADNYEFVFTKSETDDGLGDITTQYEFRINKYSVLTTDPEHWLARLMESESFSASNITISTNASAKFNASVGEYTGFSTVYTEAMNKELGSDVVVSGVTEDGYTKMSLSDQIAATTKGYDFTDKTLSIRPTWGINGNKHYYASAMSITFNAQRLTTNKSVSNADTLCLLFGPNDGEDSHKYYKLISVSDKATGAINPWQVTGGEKTGSFEKIQTASYNNDIKEYNLPEEYNISFISIGEDKWAVAINGFYYENSAINAFCNNGGLEDAYVTVSGEFGIHASCKVIDRKVNDWVASKKSDTAGVWFTRTSKNEDGTDRNLIYKGNVHTTAERVNLFETTVDFTFDITTYNPGAFKIVFSNEYGNGAINLADAAAKEDTLMFYVRNKYLADSNIYWIGLDSTKTADNSEYLVPGWAENWSAVKVRADKNEKTTNLKFNFYKEADGSYSIYINQKPVSSLKSDKVKKFFEKYADNGVFVSIASTNDDRMVCTPLLNKTTTSHKLAVAGVEIKDNTLKNVNPYVTVADLKANATVAKYYAYAVTDAAGNVLADDAVIGSGCKINVAYNLLSNGTVAVDCADHAIIVLGDTDGDASITAKDAVNVKKAVLGIDTGVAYEDALNANYDDAINVLDYIATVKSVS